MYIQGLIGSFLVKQGYGFGDEESKRTPPLSAELRELFLLRSRRHDGYPTVSISEPESQTSSYRRSTTITVANWQQPQHILRGQGRDGAAAACVFACVCVCACIVKVTDRTQEELEAPNHKTE